MNTSPATEHRLLQVEHVTKDFPSGPSLVRAVDDVTFTTGRGEITLIMGPSGSGKTTLLTIIGGLLRPTSGRIVVDGLDITALRRGDLPGVRRRYIGFVFQTFNLLESLSARENVEIALNIRGITGSQAAREASELLIDADLGERLDFKARDLSGGEKQRVSIARAVANRPPLLLADEPTANLDSRQGRQVMELIRRLADRDGTAVLVVSHDPRLRSLADSVLWLEDGRLVPGGDRDLAEPA